MSFGKRRVQRVYTKGRSVADVADNLGVTKASLYKWVQQAALARITTRRKSLQRANGRYCGSKPS